MSRAALHILYTLAHFPARWQELKENWGEFPEDMRAHYVAEARWNVEQGRRLAPALPRVPDQEWMRELADRAERMLPRPPPRTELDQLKLDLEEAQQQRDFWARQMECAGPAVDAIRELQALLCPELPTSTQHADAVVRAVRARLELPERG